MVKHDWTLKEIVTQLELCQFTDAMGHPLGNNVAFIDLKKKAEQEGAEQC